MKKAISLVLAAAMVVLVMAGCGSNKAADTSANANTNASDTPTVDISTPITYTIYIGGGDATQFNWSNAVSREITAKTGVTLQPDLDVDSGSQKLQLMLASGNYDDLVVGIPNMQQWIDANAVIPLDDLIDKYGPNLKVFYGDMINRLRWSTAYPHIYGFGSGSSTAAEWTPGNYWQVSFMVQQGDLAAQGYPKLKTLDDYENCIKSALQANPTTPDGQKRVGMDLVTSDGWRFYMSLVQPAFDCGGLPGGSMSGAGQYYLDPSSSTPSLIAGYFSPQMKTYMTWLNKMYNEGLIDPASFTQTFDDYISELSSGKVVGTIDGYWQMVQADTTLRTSANPSEAYMVFPILQDPSTMSWLEDQPGNLLNNGGISVTTACKNPERFVYFMNYLSSEEGQILRQWGIEGTNYTIDANGMRVMSDADLASAADNFLNWSQQTGVQMYANASGEWLDEPYGYKTANGQQLTSTNNQSGAYTPDDIACMTAYGIKNYCDYFPSPASMTPQKYGAIGSLPGGLTDETNAIATQIGNDILPGCVNMITCTPDQFDTQWQAWMTTLNNDGMDKMLAEANASLQDRVKLWGLN
ncbi:MAG: extracellular solute-binding protein [Defluviitaleaceae bacterium]|nr:extracellular solute-binding protein [Defluviitaleaceae bacterium]